MWVKYNIRTHHNDEISLSDLASNVINSKSVDNYISRINNSNKFTYLNEF